jgi:hypothetical protein
VDYLNQKRRDVATRCANVKIASVEKVALAIMWIKRSPSRKGVDAKTVCVESTAPVHKAKRNVAALVNK